MCDCDTNSAINSAVWELNEHYLVNVQSKLYELHTCNTSSFIAEITRSGMSHQTNTDCRLYIICMSDYAQIMEYGSTPYIGMAPKKNSCPIRGLSRDAETCPCTPEFPYRLGYTTLCSLS